MPSRNAAAWLELQCLEKWLHIVFVMLQLPGTDLAPLEQYARRHGKTQAYAC